MATMRERALRTAAKPTTLDPPSRSALFSASHPDVSWVGLDLASGTSYSSGVLVTTSDEVIISIETDASRCILLFEPNEASDAFLRAVALHGWFMLIPEGQIPVRVAVPNGAGSALASYARLRSWI